MLKAMQSHQKSLTSAFLYHRLLWHLMSLLRRELFFFGGNLSLLFLMPTLPMETPNYAMTSEDNPDCLRVQELIFCVNLWLDTASQDPSLLFFLGGGFELGFLQKKVFWGTPVFLGLGVPVGVGFCQQSAWATSFWVVFSPKPLWLPRMFRPLSLHCMTAVPSSHTSLVSSRFVNLPNGSSRMCMLLRVHYRQRD